MPYGKTKEIKKDFSEITISLASPEDILERSYGEVMKPETINYRSFKPEMGGLFCEKIFGPVKDYECHCGKYKRIRYKGIICDRCGVEVTRKAVRRERMGHISLSVPVVHIWYFKTLPNKIGHLLGLKSKDLEKVIYYENYIVIQPGSAKRLGVEENQLLTEEEYFNILYQIREDNNRLDDDDPDKFLAMIGGEAVETMLKRLELDKLSQELRYQVKTETSQQRKAKALKRLNVVESFREANQKMENRPEWMVMRVIPVIPPELRPLVPLEGGRFATSDLNDLYRRIINRNNRLKKLMDLNAPEVIIRNEKRMLQESVDALLDNGRRGRAITGTPGRALGSGRTVHCTALALRPDACPRVGDLRLAGRGVPFRPASATSPEDPGGRHGNISGSLHLGRDRRQRRPHHDPPGHARRPEPRRRRFARRPTRGERDRQATDHPLEDRRGLSSPDGRSEARLRTDAAPREWPSCPASRRSSYTG